MHRQIRNLLITPLLAAAALAAGASPAAASDATLRSEIEAVLIEVRPALTRFSTAVEGLEKAKDTKQLQAATQGVRSGLSRYKWGVINRKASSPEGLAAKKQLLTAIREYDIGFVRFERGLELIDAGSSEKSVLASLRTAAKRFVAAVEDEAAALKALGVDVG